VDVNDEKDDQTALWFVVRGAHPNVLKFLIEKGANVSWQSKKTGDTILHRSLLVHDSSVMTTLIAAGANQTIKEKLGKTPKEAAKKRLQSAFA